MGRLLFAHALRRAPKAMAVIAAVALGSVVLTAMGFAPLAVFLLQASTTLLSLLLLAGVGLWLWRVSSATVRALVLGTLKAAIAVKRAKRRMLDVAE
jgi:hypothetical protein